MGLTTFTEAKERMPLGAVTALIVSSEAVIRTSSRAAAVTTASGGGADNDKLFGGRGSDQLSGGFGRDRCDGDGGNGDSAFGCEVRIGIP